MSEYWAGLLTIPLAAVALAVVCAAWFALRWLVEDVLVRNPRINKRVYAYKVTSVSRAGDNRTDKFLGASIIEGRNLGARHDYRITFDGMSWATLSTERIPGGGWFKSHQNDVDWDPETVEELDRHIQ